MRKHRARSKIVQNRFFWLARYRGEESGVQKEEINGQLVPANGIDDCFEWLASKLERPTQK
jgi:hypothetical protein